MIEQSIRGSDVYQDSGVDLWLDVLVWSLNAKFEPDRDKADKSAKLCIQFPWDMSMKSEMGSQEKKLPVTV